MTYYNIDSDQREIRWNDEYTKIKIVGMAHWFVKRSLSQFWKVIYKKHKINIIMVVIDNYVKRLNGAYPHTQMQKRNDQKVISAIYF